MVTLERIEALKSRVEELETNMQAMAELTGRILSLEESLFTLVKSVNERMERMEGTLNSVLEHVQGRTTY